MKMRATNETLEAAALAGAVLSAGAGGSAWHQNVLEIGRLSLSFGHVEIVSLDELESDDIVITVSNVGAPSAPHDRLRPAHQVRAAQLLIEQCEGNVVGVMNSEATTVNGWIQAAALGKVVVDASGDGRGHPTIEMGSLGLAQTLVTTQTAVGGDADPLEVVAKGLLDKTSKILRQTAVQAGGLVGCARMPLPVSTLKKRAAVGAITYQIGLGTAMLPHLGHAENTLKAMTTYAQGNVLAVGKVQKVEYEMRNAFDIGEVIVDTSEGALNLTVCNEYMAAALNGQRLAVFPDLLTTISMDTGLPVAINELKVGQAIAVFHVPKSQLPLGAGVLDTRTYRDVEVMCGISLV